MVIVGYVRSRIATNVLVLADLPIVAGKAIQITIAKCGLTLQCTRAICRSHVGSPIFKDTARRGVFDHCIAHQVLSTCMGPPALLVWWGSFGMQSAGSL